MSLCEFCKEPTEGEGYVAVNVRGAMAGKQVSWHYGHMGCFPAALDYAISERDLSKPDELQAVHGLLADKRWFANTDWDSLMSRLGLNETAKGG